MGKIWVEVGSALASGQGLGARSRAEVACLQRWLEAQPFDTGFCAADPARGVFEVPAGQLREEVNRLSLAPPPSRGQQVKAKLRALLRRDEAAPAHLPAGLPPAVFGRHDVVVSLRDRWVGPEAGALDAACRSAGCPLVLGPAVARRLGLPAALAARSGTGDAAPLDLLRAAVRMAYRGAAPFEDRLQHLYEGLLRPGDHCIDIGAHTGRHCIPMSCMVGAQGSVTAFEPIPAIRERLQARLAALEIRNVTVRDAALSDESGTARFVVAVDLPEESGLRERSVYNGPTRTEPIEVNVLRLDDLQLAPPRFIKLDTEGAEFKVLLGARATIAAARPVVAFEFGEASYAAYDVDPNEVFRYFSSLGYEIFSILGDRLDQPAFVEASRVQRYWDYVASDAAAAAQVQAILQGYTGA